MLAALDATKNTIESAVWSEDGSTLLTADNSLFAQSPTAHKRETEVGFWNGQTFEFYNSANIKDIDWYHLTADGENFYSTSTPEKGVFFLSVSGMTNMINIRNTRTARNERNLSVGGENFQTMSSKMKMSPDGKYLALVSKNTETDDRHRVMVWKIGEGPTPVYTIQADPKIRESRLEYSPDGKYFALDAGKDLQIYELETGQMVKELKDQNLPDFWLDNGRIALYYTYEYVKAISIPDGSLVYQSPLFYLERTTETKIEDSFGDETIIESTAIVDWSEVLASPNGQFFLTYSFAGLNVYRAADGLKLATLIQSPPIRKKKIKIFGITWGEEKIYPKQTIESVEWSKDSRMIVVKNTGDESVSVFHFKK